ncbi:hypothetical protein QUF84_00765 [Fictibacillus enclensis]|uniref:hypothetical protein n=1 Tax=Fictibacillus enclensis TaxID=1017270 RepID=UPI0025A012D3|nr:hypothetical protein [Fictibacillus enclensis]MDM5335828.1 hypothetical protein [Fictibacillus enclensis]
MLVKFAEPLFMQDTKEGKVIVKLETNEGYLIPNEAYHLLSPANNHFLDLNSIDTDGYDIRELHSFIQDMINYGLLITKDELE